MMIRLLLFAVSLSLAATAGAQSADDMLKRRAAQKVGQMCDYIELIANPENSVKARAYYRDNALNLFINGGEAYEENGRQKDGVRMEVTSVNRKGKTSRLIKDYLNGLMNMKYSKVTISTTDVANIRVSDLKKIDDDTYMCTCYFEQTFCGYRDGKPVYRDITRKKVQCFLKAEPTEEGTEYIVMLGDITALDTRRI